MWDESKYPFQNVADVRERISNFILHIVMDVIPLGTNFSEILIKMHIFSLTKMHLKISSVKWQPFCPGRDELNEILMLNNLSRIDAAPWPGEPHIEMRNVLTKFVGSCCISTQQEDNKLGDAPAVD